MSAFGRLTTNTFNQVMCSQGDGSGTTAQNIAGKTVSGASQDTPIVLSSTGHGYSDGDFVWILDVGGNTNANGLRKVVDKTTDTFAITDAADTDIAPNASYTSGGDSFLSFVYKPTSSQEALVHRLNMYVYDGAYSAAKYMDIGPLTNGLEVQHRDGTSIISTLTACPVKIGPQWVLNAGADVQPGDGGVGNQTQMVLRWTFEKYTHFPILIDGENGEFIALIIKDDLDGLISQEMAIQGHF